MQKSIPLIAGEQARISAQGRSVLVLSTGLASSVSMQIEFAGSQQGEDMGEVSRGFKFRVIEPGISVETLVLTATVNCTVVLVVSRQNIDLGFNDGQNVTATIDPTQLPLSVDATRGTLAAPFYVSGLTYSDAPAVSIVDNAAVAVTDAGASILAADADRKSIRFANIGTDPVALGTTGQTWAKRAIVLAPGDIWLEERAPNLAWTAITAAATTASVTAQEVLV